MEKIKFNISIKEINENHFSSKPLPENDKEYIIGKNLHLAIGYAFAIKLEKSLFIYKLIVKYFTIDEDAPEFEYSFDTIFEVSELDKLIKQNNEDEYDIDDVFLKTLTGVCVGTLRGLISAKTQGTEWKKYPLPIINVAKLLKNNED